MRKELEERLVNLYLNINQLCKHLDDNFMSEHLTKQIIRSSSGAALNYGEAQGARELHDCSDWATYKIERTIKPGRYIYPFEYRTITPRSLRLILRAPGVKHKPLDNSRSNIYSTQRSQRISREGREDLSYCTIQVGSFRELWQMYLNAQPYYRFYIPAGTSLSGQFVLNQKQNRHNKKSPQVTTHR